MDLSLSLTEIVFAEETWQVQGSLIVFAKEKEKKSLTEDTETCPTWADR